VFAGNLHTVWPAARKLLFEANPALESKLQKLGLPYRICLLGRAPGTVDYYVDPKDPESTGNSIYLEQTPFFTQPNVMKLPMHRLDDVIDDPAGYDFLKLDVQGAELDILAGATETLKSIKYLFTEVSLYEYNKGAPLFYEVHTAAAQLGFRMIDLCECTVIGPRLVQFNALFERP
jgi:FkbM family methyltransferase